MNPELRNLKDLYAQFGSKYQANIKLPTGETLQSPTNPGQAATIDVSAGGVGIQREREPNLFEKALYNYLAKRGIQGQATTISRTTPSAPSAPAPLPNLSGLYTIKKGDTLSNIASNAGVELKALLTANPQFNTPGRSINQIFEGEKINLPGAGGAPAIPTTPAPPALPSVASPAELYASDRIKTLESKIDVLSADIQAGLETGGRTTLLGELFEQFGVTKERTIVEDLSALILAKTQALRKLPESLKKSLEDVGVTQSQYERLLLRESKPHEEILRDLLEQRGAAKERIGQALQFVGLFFDAEMKDRAAKLEAQKFALESMEGDYKDLRQDQREFLKIALNEQGDKLTLIGDLRKGGAPEAAVSYCIGTSRADCLAKYGSFLAKPAELPQNLEERVIGGFRVLFDKTTGQAVSTREISATETKLTPSPGFFDAKVESSAREDFVSLTGQYKNPAQPTEEEKQNTFNTLRSLYSQQEITNEALQNLVGISKPEAVTIKPGAKTPRKVGTGLSGAGATAAPGVPLPSPLAEAGIVLPDFAELQKRQAQAQDSFFANLFNQ